MPVFQIQSRAVLRQCPLLARGRQVHARPLLSGTERFGRGACEAGGQVGFRMHREAAFPRVRLPGTIACASRRLRRLSGPEVRLCWCLLRPLRRRGRSAISVAAAEQFQEAVYAALPGEMFGKQISRVLFATELHEFDGVVLNSLLDPEALRVDVTQFAEPCSGARGGDLRN